MAYVAIRVATSTISALELLFCDFSASRPRFVARLARSDSPQSRGPCTRALAAAVAQRYRGGKVASPRSSTRAPITALFLYNDQSVGVPPTVPRSRAFFWVFLVLDRHDYRVTACVHRRNTGHTSRIATLLRCLSVLACRVVILFRLYWPGGIQRKWSIS